jgi:putative hydrolase of the HAD superfamily
MPKKAIILDLDNTIYPVASIGNELFHPLFKMIEQSGEYTGDIEEIKKAIMRTPFQKVASAHNFSNTLKEQGIELLAGLTCTMEMAPFEDYNEVRAFPCKKFLVTTGFTRMQQSKVEKLNIARDFEEVHIVDPQLSNQTKKSVFKDIIDRHRLEPTDVLVVGDDPNSEIKAALELGIEAVLYDKLNFNPATTTLSRITDFKQLHDFI